MKKPAAGCLRTNKTSKMKDADYAERSSKAQLSPKQVGRLRAVLEEEFAVHGRGNFPTVTVRLQELIVRLRQRLADEGMPVAATKINGGVASYILAAAGFPYSDLDLIFHLPLEGAEAFDVVRDVVLDTMVEFLPRGTCTEKISGTTVKDVYMRKMVKVNDADRWSLFCLNNRYGRCIELKFVDRMRRQFEFSVDSFQITLDPLLDAGDEQLFCSPVPPERMASPASTLSSGLSTSDTERSGESPPDVPAESMFGDFDTALRHLNERLIDTKRPEEIRGGGLLKYCHLLLRGYRAARPWKCRQLERYMCSRFFIDFPDSRLQQLKLCSYLDNHFSGDDQAKHEYLLLLYRVISESTVCLMSHERRQTLAMIDRLAYELSLCLYYRQSCQHTPRQTLLYLPPNASYWVPVA